MKTKVEAQPSKVNKLNANSEPICANCKKSMFDGVHDKCLLNFVENVNSCAKSAKKHKKQNIWKPMGHVFTKVGFKWKPIALSKKAKIVESNKANPSEPNHTWGSNATDIPSSSSLVMTEGVDLLSGSRDTNLYIISLDDMLKTSLICLLSKASKTKSWLWHHRLSHLNFGTLNKLAKDGLARGIPRLKFQKDHLCSACALGKSKKSSHQPKAEDTNQEKLYLLHMDLCGPMRVASINGKRDDWDRLFQPMLDEYFTPPSIDITPVQEAAAPRAVVLADSHVSTYIDQDALPSSTLSTQQQEQSPIIS
ncbi:retrovirus-related pol polyprotein from transposon TNT 1-94 [Tanacetum coccineum]